MSSDIEKTRETERRMEEQLEQGYQHQMEKYLRETDHAAVEHLAEKFQDRVPPERIEAMRELPTSYEDRETFERNYLQENGQPTEPNEYLLGYSKGIERPAHVATDNLEFTRTTYHERLHQLSHPGIEQELGTRLDEGITEEFAVETAGTTSIQEGYESYPRERAIAHELREMCGDDAIEKAYFEGDTCELRQCLDRNLGAGGLERLRKHMDNLPELNENRN